MEIFSAELLATVGFLAVSMIVVAVLPLEGAGTPGEPPPPDERRDDAPTGDPDPHGTALRLKLATVYLTEFHARALQHHGRRAPSSTVPEPLGPSCAYAGSSRVPVRQTLEKLLR